MKKLAIGCAVVLALMAVGGALATRWVFQKAKATVSGFAELAQVPEIDRQVRNTAAFSPPATGELTPEMVQRYVGVQDVVRARLGERFAQLQTRYRDLTERSRRNEAGPLDVPQLIAAYRDLASAFVEARQAQVNAMNEAGFSRDEYRWVRDQVYAAVGLPIMDLDVGQIIDDIKNGRTSTVQPHMSMTVGPQGPARNQELVKPFEKKLTDNAALTMFGL